MENETDARANTGRHGSIAESILPTSRTAFYYNMEHKNRGLALIFNHEIFHSPWLTTRTGTNVDCKNLEKLLESFGFTVSIFQDYTMNEVFGRIEKVALMNHKDNDCLVVCMLTHGESGVLHAKDRAYQPEELWGVFTGDKCPSLAGKPKVFFIQACQGVIADDGMTMKNTTETDGPDDVCKIPIHADFLIAYSTIPGYLSWRDKYDGSWFIQALVDQLKKHGKKESILTVLTYVCQKVAYDFESYVPENLSKHEKKQIPCITTMLTRILKFGERAKNSTTARVRTRSFSAS